MAARISAGVGIGEMRSRTEPNSFSNLFDREFRSGPHERETRMPLGSMIRPLVERRVVSIGMG